jgi:hypothetical protein
MMGIDSVVGSLRLICAVDDRSRPVLPWTNWFNNM